MQKHHDTLNRQVADTTAAAYSEWREHIQKDWLHQGLFSSILEHPFVCGFGIVQRLSYSVLMGCRTPGPQGQKVQVNHTHFITHTHASLSTPNQATQALTHSTTFPYLRKASRNQIISLPRGRQTPARKNEARRCLEHHISAGPSDQIAAPLSRCRNWKLHIARISQLPPFGPYLKVRTDFYLPNCKLVIASTSDLCVFAHCCQSEQSIMLPTPHT